MKKLIFLLLPLALGYAEMVETSEGRVAYVDSGGAGFPVVLVHGNSVSSEVFKEQFAYFGQKYRLIAIDLPGHGKSDNAKGADTAYTIPGYAKVLNEVTEALGLEAFAVVGFSLGGNIALQWTQIPNHRIVAIMLISSAPMKYSEEAFVAYPPYEGSYAAHPNSLTEEQASQFMAACGFNVGDHLFLIEDAMRTDGKARSRMVASVVEGRGVDETEIVAHLAIPLAVVIGKEDRAINVDYVARLPYCNLWQNHAFVLPDTQHAIVLHQTGLLHPLMSAFLLDTEKGYTK